MAGGKRRYYPGHARLAPETIWSAVRGEEKALTIVYETYKQYASDYADAFTRKRFRKDMDVPLEDILQELWIHVLLVEIPKFRGK